MGDYGQLVLAAADHAEIGVVVAELAPLRIVHANERAADLLGRSVGELLGHALPLDFVVPEQRELIADRLRRRLAGEAPPPAELAIERPDGTRVVIDCRIVNTPLDDRPGVVIFFSVAGRFADLGADARYRQLVDAAPDGVAITRRGRFLYANQAALSLLGCASFEELSQLSMADVLSPEDTRVFVERTTAMARDGTRFPPRDYVVNRNGRTIVAEVSSMMIDFEGAPAVLAFVRDVTEARRARAELERTQRLTSLGTLVAGVAHEVNNPLSFASLGAEMLERYLASDLADREGARAALSNVTLGLDRIGSLVRELRAFARSDVRPVAVELSEVLASAVRMTAPTIRTRATLDIELPRLPAVHSAPGRLEQVFVNLLINAAQSFTRDDRLANTIVVRAARPDGAATITVEDNGPGIPPEDLARVFDPFFTTKSSENLGLGLAICHSIVTQHGGQIDLASTLGRGTKVSVTLPIATGDAMAKRTHQAHRRARVLVIDDEPAIGRALHTMLAAQHDLLVATSAAEACERLAEATPDAILCDLQMPEVSGLELFERVHATRPELARRFIFMTGGIFVDDALARAGGMGAPRLEKPFSAQQALDAIARVVGV